MLLGNIPGDRAREIALLGLNTVITDNVDKAQILVRGKKIVTAFLLRSDRNQYGELILSLKKDYTKQQRKYPSTLTNMYCLMVTF